MRCRVTQVTIAAAAGLALAEGDVLAVVSHDPASGQWPVASGWKVTCAASSSGSLRAVPPSRPIPSPDTSTLLSPVSTLQHIHSSLLSTPPQHNSPMHTTLKLYFVLVCVLWTCGSVI